MKETFKVGDKVVLRKSSKYYSGPGQLNDFVGTVTHVLPSERLPYHVGWVSGMNSYSDEDLQPAKIHYLMKFKKLYENTLRSETQTR